MARLKNPKTWLWIVGCLAVMVASVIYLPIEMPTIQVPPEPLFFLGPVPITNTMTSMLLADIVLVGLAFLATRKMDVIPGRLQNFFEYVIEFWQNTAEGHLGPQLAKRWLPLVLTVFFSIWFTNYLHFLPGFDSVGFLCETGKCPHEVHEQAAGGHEAGEAAPASETGHKRLAISWTGGGDGQGVGIIKKAPKVDAEHPAAPAEGPGYTFIPYLRVTASDLNFTLALALLAFLVIELAGFQKLGLGYIGKFLNFKQGAMNAIVGLLELFSEVMRIVTFSFRLFGNVFAGQTLLFVFPFLIPLLVVLPIYGLELFVGLIQAYVFAILILAFMEQAVTAHHGDEHH